ncbi:GNAT family N-acetyltransferase [Negadavirga shengliensis]|uniref:GNAT family N-acetyltransferase n=1 Tax=Negadavirga shengliensis TaxID=1389218 RepID=A0ABV9T2M0_9BACT
MNTTTTTSKKKPYSEEIYTSPDSIKIIWGDSAYELLNNKSFQTEWDQLYEDCPWATVFQSSGYSRSWYAAFHREFIPLLLYAYNEEGHLTGLLTLASRHNLQEENRGKIVVAGEYESEYQVWLSRKDNDKFIKEAFVLLLKKFPGFDVLFRFIPDGSILENLLKDPQLKKKLVTQPFQRPIMYTDAPQLPGLLKLTGQYKNKYKRLQKLGKISFVKITSFDDFTNVLPEIMAQFDFRQGAMFNKNQFKESPQKSEFFLRLFREGLLHVTLFKLDEDILASMVGIYGRNWIHLQGINTHSPQYGKHSPGILHFNLLGKLIKNEGMEAFDLTPGLDPYKERWATAHDTVYTLTLTNNRKFYLKRFLRKIIHGGLIKIGLRPMKVELWVEKQIYLIKKRSANGQLRRYWARAKNYPHAFQLPPPAAQATFNIKKNNLDDLLNYKDEKTELTRWEFLETTMKSMTEGKTIYTYATEDTLLASISVGKVIKKNGELTPKKDIPEHSYYLENIHVHPEHKYLAPPFLSAVAHEIYKQQAPSSVYVYLKKEDGGLKPNSKITESK